MVISADIQPEMLDTVKKRAVRAGLGNRIRTHRCGSNRIGVEAELDFAVAFFMLHEVPDAHTFLEELYNLLKSGGLAFIAEPIIHVSRRQFEQVVQEAQSVGFTVVKRPAVRFGRAILLLKDGAGSINNAFD